MTVKVKQVDWLSMHLEVSFHLLFTLSNPRKQREDHRSCSRRSGHAIRHDFSLKKKKKDTLAKHESNSVLYGGKQGASCSQWPRGKDDSCLL